MFVLYLLLSPLLLTLSILFRIYPPRKINYIYGYRTRRSMRDQESWDEANEFSSKLMVILSVFLNFFQALCSLLFPGKTALLVVSAVMVISLVMILPLTEYHLKKKFD